MNQKLISQTVGFISIVVLKVCDVESPTLEELMVKGEKLGAVNHGDAEGSEFFCIHLQSSHIDSPRVVQTVFNQSSCSVIGE